MVRKATLKSLQGGRKTKNETIKKVVSLAARNPGMSYQEIGDAVGRDKSTVWRALKRYGIEKARTKRYIEDRADILAGIQSNILASIDEEKIKKASLKDSAIAAGILHDKERIERGQATSIHAFADITSLINREIKEELKEEIKQEIGKTTEIQAEIE